MPKPKTTASSRLWRIRRPDASSTGISTPVRDKVSGSDYLTSPQYRAVSVGNGPVPQAMLSLCHQAGFRAMFTCIKCDDVHKMDDGMAERLLREAMDAMPERHTLQ
jgi:hypothetical protein